MIPTAISAKPEIILVSLTALGEDKKERTFAMDIIINKFPTIGIRKDTTEIHKISKYIISPKLKKPGNSVR